MSDKRKYAGDTRAALEWDINNAYMMALKYQRHLLELIEKACSGPHEFVQHRDNRPAWCHVCTYSQAGYRIQTSKEITNVRIAEEN